MEKGFVCNVDIEDMSVEGRGIGKVSGLAVFVEGAVFGDKVSAEITKVKKNYALAKMCEIIEPSPYRVTPSCKYFGKCGGCSIQSLSYEGQLILKKKMVRDKLIRLAGIEDPTVNDVIGMEVPYNYRNKAQFPISCGGLITRKGGMQENLGECAIGFYKIKSNEVVNLEECQIQSEPAVKIAQAVRQYMVEDNLTAFDPKWEKGLMRHIIVKTAVNTGEIMAVIVMNAKALPNGEKLIGLMDEAINSLPSSENGVQYSLESVSTSTHRKKSIEIMGAPCVTIAGKPTITETIGDMSFEISPNSFYQVNPVQMVKLFDKVGEYAALTGVETVLDLYCGVGSIGLYLAKKAKKVIGIESVKEAVLNANRNAVINGIVNAEYILGKAEEELPKMLGEKAKARLSNETNANVTTNGEANEDNEDLFDEKIRNQTMDISGDVDVVILDPPRAGCRIELLEAVAKATPSKIIYVSCDPATQARDVKILMGLGYEFVEAAPVDMFPQTGHVECVVLLSHKNS